MAAVTSRENTLYDNTEGILPGLHHAISSMFLIPVALGMLNANCVVSIGKKTSLFFSSFLFQVLAIPST